MSTASETINLNFSAEEVDLTDGDASHFVCRLGMDIPAANQSLYNLITARGALIRRAQRTKNDPGWRNLGPMPTTGIVLRESDIIAPGDGSYYLFNTEGDGNPHPTSTSAIIASANGSWIANGSTGVITLSTPHDIPVGTIWPLVVTGTTTESGTIGNLMSGAGRLMLATSTTTLTILSTSANGQGHGGTVTRPNSANAQIGLRKAATLAGLTSATGSNFVSRIASGLYYPTVVYIAGPIWYLFGTGAAASTVVRKSFSGAAPSAVDAFGGTATITTLANMSDLNIRLNPADNFYYCVANDINDITATTVKVFKIAAANIATDAWTSVQTNVWADLGVPSFGTLGTVDMNLIFTGNKVYMTFAASSTQAQNDWNVCIVELDSTTFKAKNSIVKLQSGSEGYPAFQGGYNLSDVQLINDGNDHLVGFTNDLSYSGLVTGTWAVLDLPAA